jgi:predicted SprT family Zn-dependent metalloprotease
VNTLARQIGDDLFLVLGEGRERPSVHLRLCPMIHTQQASAHLLADAVERDCSVIHDESHNESSRMEHRRVPGREASESANLIRKPACSVSDSERLHKTTTTGPYACRCSDVKYDRSRIKNRNLSSKAYADVAWGQHPRASASKGVSPRKLECGRRLNDRRDEIGHIALGNANASKRFGVI